MININQTIPYRSLKNCKLTQQEVLLEEQESNAMPMQVFYKEGQLKQVYFVESITKTS